MNPIDYFIKAHGAKVTSPFGMRNDPLNPGAKRMHNGTDIGGKALNYIWTSPYSGTVTHVGTHGARGLLVVVQIAPKILQIMQHLNKVLVVVGQQVVMGNPVGTNGTTGAVTGKHLHYELRWANGTPLGNPVWGDPALFTLEEVTGMVKTYVVVKGDTLAKIAARFGVTVAELRTWNNRTPEQDRSLAIGTVLFVEDSTPKGSGISQEAFDQLKNRVVSLEKKLTDVKQAL